MKTKFVFNRILGTTDVESPDAQDQVKEKIRLAAGGAIPYAIREMMKKYGHTILASDASDQEKEKAKLLICYSWWARALEGRIPRKYFEQYMSDYLNYLDDPKNNSVKKWEKYG